MAHYFATKYDSAACEVIAMLADEMEGYGVRGFGDVESPIGYVSAVALVDEDGVTVEDFFRVNYAAPVAREYDVTADDVRGYHIVTSDSQGFVSVATYATREEWQATLDALAEEFDAWAEEGEE